MTLLLDTGDEFQYRIALKINQEHTTYIAWCEQTYGPQFGKWYWLYKNFRHYFFFVDEGCKNWFVLRWHDGVDLTK